MKRYDDVALKARRQAWTALLSSGLVMMNFGIDNDMRKPTADGKKKKVTRCLIKMMEKCM